jgi:AcrR family transcriptional regulator
LRESPFYVDYVNIMIPLMLTLSTLICKHFSMLKKRKHTKTRGSRQYHHGNLRVALIEAGLKLIQKKGVRALTLREIGAQVGVSRMAAYRHFADKADLLGAISEAGFAQFADALDAARHKAGKTFALRLPAMALAYVRFAAEHPAYYEVMFGWPGGLTERPKTPGESAARAFGILEETIRQGQKTGEVQAGDSVLLARLVWAQVHGISMLRLAPDLSANGAGTHFIEFSSEVLQTGLVRSQQQR